MQLTWHLSGYLFSPPNPTNYWLIQKSFAQFSAELKSFAQKINILQKQRHAIEKSSVQNTGGENYSVFKHRGCNILTCTVSPLTSTKKEVLILFGLTPLLSL